MTNDRDRDRRRLAVLASAAAGLGALFAGPAALAQEVFAGVYTHGVGTPFTFETGEGGADILVGARFKPIEALRIVGSPRPYVIASVNTRGDTSFAGGGLSWTFERGRFYLRPGAGLVVHDGPSRRINPVTRRRTELGSRVLFEPELGLGYRISERASIEASWVHVSHARVFNWGQNPGIDMFGARVNFRL